MTNKKLKVNSATYTELAIQIATLDMKVSKVLELLSNQQQGYYQKFDEVFSIKDPLKYWECIEEGSPGKWEEKERLDTPPQWPNESHTDYLKRIGQYNEAQSCDEYYGETYK